MTKLYISRRLRMTIKSILSLSVLMAMVASSHADPVTDCEDIVASSTNQNSIIHCRGFLAGADYIRSISSGTTGASGTGSSQSQQGFKTYEPVVLSSPESTTNGHTIPEDFIALTIEPGFKSDLSEGKLQALVLDSKQLQQNVTITTNDATEPSRSVVLPKQITFDDYLTQNNSPQIMEALKQDLDKLDDNKAYTVYMQRQSVQASAVE